MAIQIRRSVTVVLKDTTFKFRALSATEAPKIAIDLSRAFLANKSKAVDQNLEEGKTSILDLENTVSALHYAAPLLADRVISIAPPVTDEDGVEIQPSEVIGLLSINELSELFAAFQDAHKLEENEKKS